MSKFLFWYQLFFFSLSLPQFFFSFLLFLLSSFFLSLSSIFLTIFFYFLSFSDISFSFFLFLSLSLSSFFVSRGVARPAFKFVSWVLCLTSSYSHRSIFQPTSNKRAHGTACMRTPTCPHMHGDTCHHVSSMHTLKWLLLNIFKILMVLIFEFFIKLPYSFRMFIFVCKFCPTLIR